jgi:isoleucyl-tRNA synthetase
MRIVQVSAPFIPFVTESIYRNLRAENMPESIHLCEYPTVDESKRDSELESKMATTRRAVSLGRAIRSMHSLKNRQPLRAIHLVTRDAGEKRVLREMEDIIRDELNVKEVIFRENEDELVEYQAKANYRLLGPQLGKHMKEAAGKIEALEPAEIQSILDGARLEVEVGGENLELTSDKILVQREEKENLKVLNEGSLTVALDPEITPELVREGTVRDLIRQIQTMRKDQGLDVQDRVELYLQPSPEVREAVEDFEEYLMNETLAVDVKLADHPQAQRVEVGDYACAVAVEKVES